MSVNLPDPKNVLGRFVKRGLIAGAVLGFVIGMVLALWSPILAMLCGAFGATVGGFAGLMTGICVGLAVERLVYVSPVTQYSGLGRRVLCSFVIAACALTYNAICFLLLASLGFEYPKAALALTVLATVIAVAATQDIQRDVLGDMPKVGG